MKKVAIGCGVVLLLGCVIVGGLAFWAYRRVQQTVAQFSELAQVPEIERQVRVKDPFVPPASEELTSSQLEQLLRVQAAIRERLGTRFAEFEKQYKVFSEKDKATLTDVPTLIAGYRDLGAHVARREARSGGGAQPGESVTRRIPAGSENSPTKH